MSLLQKYLHKIPEKDRSTAAIAYLAALDHIKGEDPFICQKIINELRDQRSHLKMIASENFSSFAVQLSMGNWLTDKYAEGYPQHRFYAGCDNVDAIEQAAIDGAKKIFGSDHAYVQPHSGADANMVAYWAILIHRVQTSELIRLGKKNIDEVSPEEHEKIRKFLLSQKMMGMALGSGGHLTHGYRHNVSSKMMQAVAYDVDPHTGLIDYAALKAQVLREKPAILMVGYSAYPRLINFAVMREIADAVGATLLVDMAHFAGLVAGKVMRGEFNPIPFAHVVTSTTHKTLRGPRGGFVLCTKEYREVIDKGCPLVLGGPLPHVMAAKAIAFKEAATPAFEAYAHQIVANARALAKALMEERIEVLTGGTDNHLLVANVTPFGLNGRQAEGLLRDAFITVNRNAIARDPHGPWYTSGVRLGTPALTTLGMKEKEMVEIARLIGSLLRAAQPTQESRGKTAVDPRVLENVQKRVAAMLDSFPLYPEIVID